MAMLGEQFVHGEDIRQPLGTLRKYSGEPLTQADFLKGSRRFEGVSGTTKRDRGNLASGRLCAYTGNKLGRDAVAARPQ